MLLKFNEYIKLNETLGSINTREEKTDFGTVWYYDAEDGSFRFAVYQYDDDPDTVYLANVFVKDESRGQGKGNTILKNAELIAKDRNASTICLKVKNDSFVHKWYERNGYFYLEEDDEDPTYIWMKKEIS